MIKLEGFSDLQLIDEASERHVYRGTDIATGDCVIIKYLANEVLNQYEAYQLRHEYEICRYFSGPEAANAVRLERCGDGLQIVFRDYGGESINKLIEKNSLSIRSVLEMAIKIVESLAEVHSRNIIHKDIKPANIVYNKNTKSMQIIDFGVCRQVSREKSVISNPRTLEGSLHYMAPEQTGRMNRAVDYRADYYSLGITLYEMLTGVKPFIEDDPLSLVYCHIAVRPKPIREVNPNVPSQLENVVNKLMCKLAEGRYQGAWGIKADLEECLSQLDIHGTIREFRLGVHDIPEQFHLPQKMVGRETDVARLLDGFNKCCSGKMCMTLVGGYSGMGKTTIVNEIYKPVTKSRGAFVSGKFNLVQKNIPYSALVVAFQELVKNLLSEPERILKPWRDTLMSALGENSQVIVDVIPEMRHLIGGSPPLAELGSEENQNRFELTFLKFIQAFCIEKHPLVIFLDNMQWADNATFRLLELLAQDNEIPYLYIVGAYRNNEISAVHPIHNLKSEWYKNNQIVSEVELLPLSAEQVNELVADALFKDLDSTTQLAQLVSAKTDGNPFFIEQFLKTLYDDKLLAFHQAWGEWSWDIAEIEKREITDNVVSLMAAKIEKLPSSTQYDLKLAACIGNQFRIGTLMSLSGKSKNQIIESLKVAIAQGLIVVDSKFFIYMLVDRDEASTDVDVEFFHGRIQQAAYSLLSENVRLESHLKIGRLLHEEYRGAEREGQIFEIANHYVLGQELLHDDEKEQFLNITFDAARKAFSTAAYDSAYRFISVCIDRIDEQSWRLNYSNTFSLIKEAAIIYHRVGDYDGMGNILEAGLERASSPIDCAQLYEIKVLMYESLKQFEEAVTAVITGLELLGVSLNREPGVFTLLRTFLSLKRGMKYSELVALGEKKTLARADIQLAHRMMLKAGTIVYLGAPKVIPSMLVEGIMLVEQHGGCTEASIQYSIWGGIALCGVFGDIEGGYQISRRGFELTDADNYREFRARVYLSHHCVVAPWKYHLKDSVQGLLEGYHIGVKIGDQPCAANCIAFYFYHSFLCGLGLPRLTKELVAYQSVVMGFKEEMALQLMAMSAQLFRILEGESTIPSELKGDLFDISEAIESCIDCGDNTMLCMLYTNSLLLAYHFGHYEEALEWADKAADLLYFALGTVIVPLFHFYDCLVRIAMYNNMGQLKKIKFKRSIKRSLRKIEQWSKHCPDNFSHRYWLMKAEYERMLGRRVSSMDAYDKSIALAYQFRYTCELGLAQELAARFYLGLGKVSPAQAYAKEARRTYEDWGALGKVDYLDKEFSSIMNRRYELYNVASKHSQSMTKRIANIVGELDFSAAIKSFQAISSEINLTNLLIKVVTTAMQASGATRALYFSCSGEEAKVEVETDVKGSCVYGEKDDLKGFDKIPKTLIQYVLRTQEEVLLSDACQKNIFENDVYIKEYHPRSIVCLPVMINNSLEAVLYLEHDELPAIFTAMHNEILQMIATQAGISVQNARLYSAVEESESKYRSLFDNASEGFFQIDKNENYRLVNQAFVKILGYTDVDSFLRSQRMPHEFYKYKEDYYDLEKKLSNRSKVQDFETIGIAVDGREFNVLINAYVIDRGGERLVEGLVRDITERKRLETMRLAKESAELSNKAKSELLANVSHEIRTPMNALMGFTDLMANTALDSDQVDYVKKIQDSSKVLLRVIDEVLDYSNIGKGRFDEPEERAIEGSVTSTSLLIPDYRGMKALLVDDNTINRQIGAALLQSFNLAVEVADGGQQAIEKITHTQYDIVFMDIQMPMIDGFEAVKCVRSRAATKQLVVIAMTGSTNDGDELRCLDAGFSGYLAKPVNKKSIAAVLRQWLELEVSGPGECSVDDEWTLESVLEQPFPGLNVRQGLDKVNGDFNIYVALLNSLHADFSGSVSQIKTALKRGELKEAMKISHNLKGVAGNLSAENLYLVAIQVDDALRLHEMDEINPLLDSLEMGFKEIADSIKELESSAAVPQSFAEEQLTENKSGVTDLQELGDLLQQLTALLKDNDLESESCFKELSALLKNSKVSAEVDELAKFLDKYDFKAAVGSVGKITQRFDL